MLAEIREALMTTARRDITANQSLGVQLRPTLPLPTPAIQGTHRRPHPGTQQPQRGYPEDRYKKGPLFPHWPQAEDIHHPETPRPLTDAQRRPQAMSAQGSV